ncbi:MAG TPA: TatD family hydrolase [bacterium]|nr:TatD family hydrolase [bacterium]
MIIDTHCHLNFNDFKDDYLEIINKTLAEEVSMIIVGSNLKTSERGVKIVNNFPSNVYTAIGLHPIHLQNEIIKSDKSETEAYEFITKKEDYQEENYQRLIDDNKKIVAIGEIGLEYFHLNGSLEEIKEIKKLQQQIFIRQLNLALKNNLPVIIHCREAHEDLYKILKDFFIKNPRSNDWGVIHCFSGDYDLAKKYIDLGLKISFTGLITFVNQWDEVIKKIPLEKIMVETDSPYLSPIPFRGRRNEPLHVKEVIKKIAELKALSIEEVAEITYKNAQELFNLKG